MLDVSPSELVVCAHICAGYSTKETANKLFRSVYTITTHLTRIRVKNNLKGVAEISREFVLIHGDPNEFLRKNITTKNK
jgi:DNA-binding CsgD family transcriptional regulator